MANGREEAMVVLDGESVPSTSRAAITPTYRQKRKQSGLWSEAKAKCRVLVLDCSDGNVFAGISVGTQAATHRSGGVATQTSSPPTPEMVPPLPPAAGESLQSAKQKKSDKFDKVNYTTLKPNKSLPCTHHTPTSSGERGESSSSVESGKLTIDEEAMDVSGRKNRQAAGGTKRLSAQADPVTLKQPCSLYYSGIVENLGTN
ncbi:hypothetical protein Pmani_026357 [Petrolisthes manimaculis]|uniref:Uncharacterized protein n=1 Tax=Petrolisthes manimaculis TaxID=1843537 RepID=A0AAE1U087_9EUCA|nr:hypothetical protein Pmani_026357 [Petrolisthes manimaculis]